MLQLIAAIIGLVLLLTVGLGTLLVIFGWALVVVLVLVLIFALLNKAVLRPIGGALHWTSRQVGMLVDESVHIMWIKDSLARRGWIQSTHAPRNSILDKIDDKVLDRLDNDDMFAKGWFARANKTPRHENPFRESGYGKSWYEGWDARDELSKSDPPK